MAYISFDPTKPTDAQTVSEFIDSVRENQLACSHASVAGILPGWDGDITTPGAEPDILTYSLGTERIKLTYTWSAGNPATIKYEYSSNSGTDYDPMFSTNGLQTLTYDGSGFVSYWRWT